MPEAINPLKGPSSPSQLTASTQLLNPQTCRASLGPSFSLPAVRVMCDPSPSLSASNTILNACVPGSLHCYPSPDHHLTLEPFGFPTCPQPPHGSWSSEPPPPLPGACASRSGPEARSQPPWCPLRTPPPHPLTSARHTLPLPRTRPLSLCHSGVDTRSD